MNEVVRNRRNAYSKYWRKTNNEKVKSYNKSWYANYREESIIRASIWAKNNKEKVNARNKIYRINNPEKIKITKAIWHKNNREKCRLKNIKWKLANPIKDKKSKENWRLKHPDLCKLYNKRSKENQFRNNPALFNCKKSIRWLILKSINKMGYTKKSRTYKILGCSFGEFKSYIENKFTKGMTWENHGEWHIDHIIPMASAKTEEAVLKLNYYTNFQPLWATTKIAEGYGEVNYIGNLEKYNKF